MVFKYRVSCVKALYIVEPFFIFFRKKSLEKDWECVCVWVCVLERKREREREREIGYSMQWNLIAITEWGGTKLVPAGNKLLLIEKTVKQKKQKM
jgi:hypothetical protein